MSVSVESNRCPKCGAPIPSEAPQGLCPKCLLQELAMPTDAGKPARAEAPTREEVATAFPHLEIVELIGQGGMGVVYKARQPKLDRVVALKILPQSLAADPTFTERFIREGRVLAKLNHPNIVTIHDFGESNGFFYLLMEYVSGVNLRQAMKAGRFTPAQALSLIPEICEALQYAHTQGVLHRDVKPENILLDTAGRVKIADFGIAKLVTEAHTEALTGSGTIGTPHYMAPEQIERPGEVDHRADIYSLGVVLYELLTGELPIGHFPPPSRKTPVNPEVDALVLRALEKERERRYQSAGEVKTKVEEVTNSNRGWTDDEWVLKCLTCGKTGSLRAAGGIRIGAASRGKRTLVWCSQCLTFRCAAVVKGHDAEKIRVPPEPVSSVWLRWLGILFLALGTVCWVPSFFLTNSRFEWHPASLAIVTGLALLIRHQLWLRIAFLSTVIALGTGLFDWLQLLMSGSPSLRLGKWVDLVPWLVLFVGLLVLMRRGVGAAFVESSHKRPGVLTIVAAFLVPALIFALPFFAWRTLSWKALNPPTASQADPAPAPATASLTKTFVFRDSSVQYERRDPPSYLTRPRTNGPSQPQFSNQDRMWDQKGSLGLATTTPLTPGESLLALMQDPDGQMRLAGVRRYILHAGSRSDDNSVSLWWGMPDTFTLDQIQAFTKKWTDKPVQLRDRVSEPIFWLTNEHGAVTTGYLQYVFDVPDTTKPASIRVLKAVWEEIYKDHFTATLEMGLPKGHTLEVLGFSLAGLEQQTRIFDHRTGNYWSYSCSWYPPATFKQEQHDEAIRQLQGAAFVLASGERRRVFSVTNAALEIFEGYLQLTPEPRQRP